MPTGRHRRIWGGLFGGCFRMFLRDSPYRGGSTLAAAAELAAEGRGPDKEGYRPSSAN